MEKDVRQPRRSPCRARERCRPHAAETKDPGPQRCRRAGPAKTVVLLAHADVIGRVSGTYRAGRRTRTFGSSACCSTWHLLLRSIRRSHRNEFGGGLPGPSRRKVPCRAHDSPPPRRDGHSTDDGNTRSRQHSVSGCGSLYSRGTARKIGAGSRLWSSASFGRAARRSPVPAVPGAGWRSGLARMGSDGTNASYWW